MQERALEAFPDEGHRVQALVGVTARSAEQNLARLALGRAPADEVPGTALVTSFARLLDRSITEYRRGRAQLMKADHTGLFPDLPRVLKAVDHFETCIDATSRAAKLALAMRTNAHRQLPKIDKTLLPPKDALRRLTAVRDAVQHAEERLMKFGLPAEQTAFVAPMREHLRILKAELSYAELAGIIQGLHAVLRGLFEAADERYLARRRATAEEAAARSGLD